MNVLWIEDILENVTTVLKADEPEDPDVPLREVVFRGSTGNGLCDFKVYVPKDFDSLEGVLKYIETQYDFFILDINLAGLEGSTNRGYGELSDIFRNRLRQCLHLQPEEIIPVEKIEEFKKIFGYHFYNILIENRVPRERICFYTANATGEDNSYTKIIKRSFEEAKLPLPDEVFDKTKSNMKSITDWMHGYKISKDKKTEQIPERKETFEYLQFRRHVINTCTNAAKSPPSDPTIFCGQDRQRELIDYFTRLIHMLPLRMDLNSLQDVFKHFLRELSAPFDNFTNKKNVPVYYPLIAKNIRNWTAHNRCSDILHFKDMYFLFDLVVSAIALGLLKIKNEALKIDCAKAAVEIESKIKSRIIEAENDGKLKALIERKLKTGDNSNIFRILFENRESTAEPAEVFFYSFLNFCMIGGNLSKGQVSHLKFHFGDNPVSYMPVLRWLNKLEIMLLNRVAEKLELN